MRFTASGTHRGESEEIDEVFRAFIEGQVEDSPISAEEEKVVEEFASPQICDWLIARARRYPHIPPSWSSAACARRRALCARAP